MLIAEVSIVRMQKYYSSLPLPSPQPSPIHSYFDTRIHKSSSSDPPYLTSSAGGFQQKRFNSTASFKTQRNATVHLSHQKQKDDDSFKVTPKLLGGYLDTEDLQQRCLPEKGSERKSNLRRNGIEKNLY